MTTEIGKAAPRAVEGEEKRPQEQSAAKDWRAQRGWCCSCSTRRQCRASGGGGHERKIAGAGGMNEVGDIEKL
ncbi:hypothetical protein BHE74_00019433 [Ensete ventricosum]|nr:hypothetical protein GW17_00016585 [Ensete ventricosum]RWW72751.1 hypothetical protein BHE74_00019433 [Ensete ventricosum]RZR96621.1 hypothetical protein BHM03_00025675 [Ensete ventricosum]